MAVIKNKATRKTHVATLDATPRHLWLASLGTLVAVKRESKTAAQRIVIGVDATATRIFEASKRAQADLDAGKCDLIAVGKPFIANPDLVARWKAGAKENTPDMATFYTPGAKGYTDYPFMK